MAIVHPVRHKNTFTIRTVGVVVTCCWVIGIAYPVGTYSAIAQVVNGTCYVSYNWPPIALPMSIVNFLVKMMFPILFYAVFYALTFAFLRNRG